MHEEEFEHEMATNATMNQCHTKYRKNHENVLECYFYRDLNIFE